jgi:hypothetical protein
MIDRRWYKELRFKHDIDYRWMFGGVLFALSSYGKDKVRFDYWPLEYCMDAKES